MKAAYKQACAGTAARQNLVLRGRVRRRPRGRRPAGLVSRSNQCSVRARSRARVRPTTVGKRPGGGGHVRPGAGAAGQQQRPVRLPSFACPSSSDRSRHRRVVWGSLPAGGSRVWVDPVDSARNHLRARAPPVGESPAPPGRARARHAPMPLAGSWGARTHSRARRTPPGQHGFCGARASDIDPTSHPDKAIEAVGVLGDAPAGRATRPGGGGEGSRHVSFAVFVAASATPGPRADRPLFALAGP